MSRLQQGASCKFCEQYGCWSIIYIRCKYMFVCPKCWGLSQQYVTLVIQNLLYAFINQRIYDWLNISFCCNLWNVGAKCVWPENVLTICCQMVRSTIHCSGWVTWADSVTIRQRSSCSSWSIPKGQLTSKMHQRVLVLMELLTSGSRSQTLQRLLRKWQGLRR